VTDSSADSPALSATETRAAESILATYWGASVTVVAAEKIWDRYHIVRLHIAGDDRSVVLKRTRAENFGDRSRGFDAELAALEFLNSMENAVAPRLYGADPSAGILIVEDLGPGSSLADSLLARVRGHAEADLVSYARAMATMHAWSVPVPRVRRNQGTPCSCRRIPVAASRTALPRLRSAAEALHEQLRLRWPDTVVPDYPALARPGATLAQLHSGPEA
jgi:hypothetical protein